MKRVLTSMTVWALTVAFSPMWVTGCSVDASEKTEATGTLDLGLTGTSVSGRTYRLRNGKINISGTATATVLTEEHLNETSVALELKAGAYLAKLATGWTLERGTLDATTGELVFENVKAVLISTNPLPFMVNDQLTTQVRFQFNAGDEVVQLGNGRAVIGFDVNDCIGSEAAFCDADGDGFPPGEDCDDNNPDTYPGAPDFCDGQDNNCDGIVDEFCGCLPGDPGCDADGDGFPADIDCNDFNFNVFPGAFESCDMLDNNCNGLIDEGCGGCFPGDPGCDNDGDGFPADIDCNDSNANVFPGAFESCDMLDNNCNGLIDEGCGGCFPGDPGCDNDGDGFPADIDCNDSNANVFPGAFEFCDMQDNDCNGLIDEVGCGCDPADPGCDNDGDGFPANVDCNDFNASVFPGATDICDGQDNDCDALFDEDCFSCSVVPQAGCGPGQSCYLVGPSFDTACFPSGSIPPGAPCDEVSPNDCLAPAVCAPFNGPPSCWEICDMDSPACSGGQACLNAQPNPEHLGICF